MPNQKISELPESEPLYASRITANKEYKEELLEEEKLDLQQLYFEDQKKYQDLSSLQFDETSTESDISSLQVDRAILETEIDGFIPTEEEQAELNQIYSDIDSLIAQDINIEYDISSLQSNHLDLHEEIAELELKTADRHYLLIARENFRNEKISFTNLHRSVLTDAAYLKSDQYIRGEKIFQSPCTIKKKVNVTELKDLTTDGTISGNIFWGQTGYYKDSVSNFPDTFLESNVVDSSLFEKDFYLSGSMNLSEDLYKSQSFKIQQIYSSQDSHFTSLISGSSDLHANNIVSMGDWAVRENLDCLNDIYIEKDIIFPNEKIIEINSRINFIDNSSTKLKISDSLTSFKDDLYIFNSTINKAGTLSDIETQGSLNVLGNSYIEKIYSKYNNEYKPIIAGADESIQFRTQVLPNQQQQKIYLPKTFHSAPVVHCTLENSDGSVDFSLMRVDKSFIEIKLSSVTTLNNLYINILACSPSEYSPNKDSIVRFTTPLYATNYFIIGFPTAQDEIPTILNQLEGDIITEHAIFSVTKSAFSIRFADVLPAQSKLHTILTVPQKQKLN